MLDIKFMELFVTILIVGILFAIAVGYLLIPMFIGKLLPINGLSVLESTVLAMILFYPFSFIGIMLYLITYFFEKDKKNNEKHLLND